MERQEDRIGLEAGTGGEERQVDKDEDGNDGSSQIRRENLG